ncbi:archease [Methanobrevibacter sp. 87.7]|uniref:archease n=1 Tax=Methanobrevibacter sp. 87.7 TaxID=387957 RepID=UPI000B4FFB9B|nr:archease [Methanobrevibacter sp. 87.7]OWT33308.1 archease [Methanobrevibacter sp. 87.7]
MSLNNEYQIKLNKPYEFFDVTADIGFFAYGETLEESFENSGLAMFNVISNTSNVECNEEFNIEVESEDLVSLLYDYLEELLFLSDVNFVLFSDFNISIIKGDKNLENPYKLKGIVKGESMDWNKHQRGSEVKAITFHMMEVLEKNEYFMTRVILDL